MQCASNGDDDRTNNAWQEKEELIYKFAGLNHFHWHKVADNKGNDRTAELIDRLYDEDNGLPKISLTSRFQRTIKTNEHDPLWLPPLLLP